MSLCVVGASFCHSFSSTASAISGMLSLRRVLTAVEFGDMRPWMGSCRRLAANVTGACLFWRCRLMIGSLSHRVMAGLGSPVRSRKGKKRLLLCAHKTRAGTQKAFKLLLSRRSFAVLAWMRICNWQLVALLDLIARVDASLFVSLLACRLAMGLIEIQRIETTKWFPNKKNNLTAQKRHSKEYKVRLSWLNGGFPASAPIVRRKKFWCRVWAWHAVRDSVSMYLWVNLIQVYTNDHVRVEREMVGMCHEMKTCVFFTIASPAPRIAQNDRFVFSPPLQTYLLFSAGDRILISLHID